MSRRNRRANNRREEPNDEFSNMGIEDLKTSIKALEQSLNDSQKDRNLKQQERDLMEQLQIFEENEKAKWERLILEKEAEFQEQEKQQHLSLMSFRQRLIYLEFEKDKMLEDLDVKWRSMASEEAQRHRENLQDYEKNKRSIKTEIEKANKNNVKEVGRVIFQMLETEIWSASFRMGDLMKFEIFWSK